MSTADNLQPDFSAEGGLQNLVKFFSNDYKAILTAITDELSEVKLDREKRELLKRELNLPDDVVNRWQDVNDIIKHFDLMELADKHPDAAKGVAVNVLSAVGAVFPPLLIAAAVVKAVPAEALSKMNNVALAVSPDHLIHALIEYQAKKKQKLHLEFQSDVQSGERGKKLIVVCSDDEIYEQVQQMIASYNKNPLISVFGTPVTAERWTEDKWYYRMKHGLLTDRMLLVGKVKGTKELRKIMNIREEEFGVCCGSLGETVFIETDPSALSAREDYQRFLEKLSELPVPDSVKKDVRMKMNFGTGVKIALATPLLAKDFADERKELTKQQQYYGVTRFMINGLKELMDSPT